MAEVKFCGSEGQFGVFSNHYQRKILIDGKEWPSTEHFFQAQKFTSEDYQDQIRTAPTPEESKKLGYARRPDFRKDWEQVKDSLMKKAQVAKYTQHEDLKKQLLETGDRLIVEDNPADAYWGNGPDGHGRNMLGKLIMEVRDDLRKQ